MLHLRSSVLGLLTTPIVVRSEESDPCINELTHDKTFRRIQCDLTEVPTDIPGDVRQVFLEANRIRTVPSEAFSHLSRCTLLFMGKYIILYITVPTYSWLSTPDDLPLQPSSGSRGGARGPYPPPTFKNSHKTDGRKSGGLYFMSLAPPLRRSWIHYCTLHFLGGCTLLPIHNIS